MSFSVEVKNWTKKTKADIIRARRIAIIKLFSAVVFDTPVDTGRLRGNWIITENAPSKEVRKSADKGGAVVIANVLEKTTGHDGVLFFVNNLPYAHRIEYDSWSQQAPGGMVRKNIARINRFLKEAGQEAGL